MPTGASRKMKSIELVTSAVRPLNTPKIRALSGYEGCLFFTFMHSWVSLNKAESDTSKSRSICQKSDALSFWDVNGEGKSNRLYPSLYERETA